MVDLGGNFNGYMGDMSRVFSIGKLSEEAYTAHQVCLDIQAKDRFDRQTRHSLRNAV